MRFDDGQPHPRVLHLPVTPAERAQKVGARHFEPHEIIGVVSHPHLVGLGVADAHSRRGGGAPAHCGTATPAAARRSRMARARSVCLNSALPTTSISAPASATRPALV